MDARSAAVAAGFSLCLSGGSAAAVLSGYTVETASTSIDPTSPKALEVECPEGRVALGGGVRITGSTLSASLTATAPIGFFVPTGWAGAAHGPPLTFQDWGLEVSVICVRDLPGIEWNIESTETDETAFKARSITCSDTTVGYGRGAQTYGSGAGATALITLEPNDSTPPIVGEDWFGEAREIASASGSWGFRLDAICGDDIGRWTMSTTGPQEAGSVKNQEVPCPFGLIALGGATSIVGADSDRRITASVPDGPAARPNGWRGAARSAGVDQFEWALRTTVTCPEPVGAGLAAVSTLLGVVRRRASRRRDYKRTPRSWNARAA
jgi:hypothetical protein